jgi:hypothetical protein
MAKSKPATLVPFQPRRNAAVASLPLAIAKAFEDFERAVGGREELIATLAITELTPEIEAVLVAIADPTTASKPLADVCLAHNLLPGALVSAYKNALLIRAQVLALKTVAGKVPAVAAEIVRCALPHDEPCPRCYGDKTITMTPKATKKNPNPQPVTETCYRCTGKGTIQVEASESQQDRVLDLAQLVSKGGGLNIGIATQINAQSGSAAASVRTSGGSLGQLQQAVAAVLSGKVSAPSPTYPAANPAPDGVAAPTPEVSTSVVDATILPEEPDAPVRLVD